MITNRDQVIDGLSNKLNRFIVDKASIPNQLGGRMCSLWRATGQPAQAVIPTTPAICTSVLLGSIAFPNQVLPVKNHLGHVSATPANSSTNLEFRDRLIHNGGLLLNVITSQVITGLDLSTLNVGSERLGEANYSDVEWFLEVYADGGATASNATINVTYSDGSTGNLNLLPVGGTLRAANMLQLTPLIPTAKQGFFIRGINSVILSASTGTAGNFGFTATIMKTSIDCNLGNKTEVRSWSQLGLPYIANDTCLFMTVYCSTTTSGLIRANGKIIYG